MNLVVAGAVAVTPVVGCDTAAKPMTDAAAHMDAIASDSADAGTDAVASIDTDAEDDANLDAYPDGVRG